MYYKHTLTLIISLFFINISKVSAQNFSNTDAITLTDNGITLIPINVTSIPPIDTVNFGLQNVTIYIEHPHCEQLTLQLISPAGDTVLLAEELPGAGFENCVFDGVATKYIDNAEAPFTGSFRSLQDLSRVNNGSNPVGNWILRIIDNSPGEVGTCENVKLNFSSNPAKPILSSSSLPIIKIYTNGNKIIDDPKIVADMVIINNGPGQYNYSNQTTYDYSGKIGIEIRGQSSQSFPKKQFSVETRDADGIASVDISLLGLPKESDWVLSSNYADKTMMRNNLAYQLAREMGHYSSRTIYCELMINDEYKGVYVLAEKIKRDKNRVNVEKLGASDITAPNVTGGYIFSIDKAFGADDIKWVSSVPGSTTEFVFVYPKKVADLQPEQKQYLIDYVDSFEQALNGPDFKDPLIGFRKYAEETSFMDYFLLNELTHNADAYRISSYFHKSRNGKIVAGPFWDYDNGWGYNVNGYSYEEDYAGDFKVPFWWSRLLQDDGWKQNMICRFSDLLNTTFSSAHINFILDSLTNVIAVPQQRNFTRWDEIGKYIWPNPTPVAATFFDEVSTVKQWIADRLDWLKSDLGSTCSVLPISVLQLKAIRKNASTVLKWTSLSQQEIRSFDIERSTDNISYTSTGKIDRLQGNMNNDQFTFTDNSSSESSYYYRIRQTTVDGKVSYSNIVLVQSQSGTWSLYPNLVTDNLIIFSPFSDHRKIKYSIFDMQGKLIKTRNVINQNRMTENIVGLTPGGYILTITDESGHHNSLKFICR